MEHDEKEQMYVKMVIAVLISFTVGVAVGGVIVDRLNARNRVQEGARFEVPGSRFQPSNLRLVRPSAESEPNFEHRTSNGGNHEREI